MNILLTLGVTLAVVLGWAVFTFLVVMILVVFISGFDSLDDDGFD
jgi:hypothetical protein